MIPFFFFFTFNFDFDSASRFSYFDVLELHVNSFIYISPLLFYNVIGVRFSLIGAYLLRTNTLCTGPIFLKIVC